MAKKKQEYSEESVDEMVERLKRSYESAERDEGEDADTEADDEAFAQMLVECSAIKGKPSLPPKPRAPIFSAPRILCPTRRTTL